MFILRLMDCIIFKTIGIFLFCKSSRLMSLTDLTNN